MFFLLDTGFLKNPIQVQEKINDLIMEVCVNSDNL